MSLPDYVDIGPHRYAVEVVPHFVRSAGVLGACNKEDLTIIVGADQADTQQAETLLHEAIGHALLAPAGLEEEVEERVALVLGSGVLALLRDNPELVDYIVDLYADA